MSIVKALFDQSVISTDECFGQPDVTSQEMRDAINAWRNTYLKREGDKASDPCMRMAYVIVHKLQKGVFAEYSSDILDKEKTAKGKWMDRNLSQLDLIRDSILQWMLIGGECWVKPVPRPGPDGSTIFAPLLVHRTDAVILAREPDGRVTSIVTAEHTARGSQYYTLLERRTVDANGYLTIENKLYVSFDRGALGIRTALSKLDRYAQLPDLYTYPVPVGGVGMTPLRVPLANCVDGSMDAISIYEPAMGLIRNIDQNEKQLNDEFELARHRLIAPAEMLKTGRDGRRTLDDSVFVALEAHIRNIKNKTLADDALGDKENLQKHQLMLARYRQEYSRYCKATGLQPRSARLQAAGFGRSEATRAAAAAKRGTAVMAKNNSPKMPSSGILNAKKVFQSPQEINAAALLIDAGLDDYGLPASVFSGKTLLKDKSCSALGRAEWSGDVSVREDAGLDTLVHELLHMRSANRLPNMVYSANIRIEEATVQLLAQEICIDNGIEILAHTYEKGVRYLQAINKTAKIAPTDLEFGQMLLNVPLDKRHDWLVERVDDFIAANNIPRDVAGGLRNLSYWFWGSDPF